MIPKCQFSANVVLKEEDEVPPLQHRVNLIGTKLPFNSVMFEINPPGTVIAWMHIMTLSWC